MKLGMIVHKNFSKSLEVLMRMPGVPPKTMFNIRGIAKVISDESAKYDDIRKSLIEQCGKRDENGGLITRSLPSGESSIEVSPEQLEVVNVKLKELSELEIKLNEIKFSDLGDQPSLTSEDLFYLEFIVE